MYIIFSCWNPHSRCNYYSITIYINHITKSIIIVFSWIFFYWIIWPTSIYIFFIYIQVTSVCVITSYYCITTNSNWITKVICIIISSLWWNIPLSICINHTPGFIIIFFNNSKTTYLIISIKSRRTNNYYIFIFIYINRYTIMIKSSLTIIINYFVKSISFIPSPIRIFFKNYDRTR